VIASGAAPQVQNRDLVLIAAGLLLLAVYGSLRARGRDPLGGNPAPEARFGFADTAAVFLLGYLAMILSFDLALRAGVGRESVDLRLLGYAGPVPVALVAAWVYLRRAPGHGSRGKGALAGVLLWIASFPLVAAVLLATVQVWTATGRDWPEQQVLVDLRGAAPWKFFLAAIVQAPLFEEILFRGMLYSVLAKRAGTAAATAVSAVAFAAVHGSLPHAPALFVLGCALAWCYAKTGTIVAPIAFHAAFNGWTFLGEMLRS